MSGLGVDREKTPRRWVEFGRLEPVFLGVGTPPPAAVTFGGSIEPMNPSPSQNCFQKG